MSFSLFSLKQTTLASPCSLLNQLFSDWLPLGTKAFKGEVGKSFVLKARAVCLRLLFLQPSFTPNRRLSHLHAPRGDPAEVAAEVVASEFWW